MREFFVIIRLSMAVKSLSSEDVQNLVAKAFVLEAITDKPGCTTRYSDLPGRPLQDFVVAGINSAAVFRYFADALHRDPATPVFSFNESALKVSNQHKSAKYMNLGLLEIMFPTVAARIQTDDPTKICDEVISIIKNTTNADVRCVLATREIAWSTTNKLHKANFDFAQYRDLPTVWEFYERAKAACTPDMSLYQWVNQYEGGMPILRAFFEGYTRAGEVMHSTKTIFMEQREANPMTQIGILADMCAAALFLWLSFNEGSV